MPSPAMLEGNLWQQLLVGGLGGILAIIPSGSTGAGAAHVFPVDADSDYGSVHHDYAATDIFAACGSSVVSPVAGTVLEVNRVDRWDPVSDRGAARGGRFVSILGRDGVRYYGSHLSTVREVVEPGATVWAGRAVGRVGRSGSARSTSCHLHFGISPVCAGTGQWWIRRGVVGPYRFLGGWRAGRSLSPADAVTDWERKRGCPSPP